MNEYHLLLGAILGFILAKPIARMIYEIKDYGPYNPNRREEEFTYIMGFALCWLTPVIFLCLIVIKHFK